MRVVTTVKGNVEKYLKALESRRLSTDEITKTLDGKLADHTTLITDKHPSRILFARENPALAQVCIRQRAFELKIQRHSSSTYKQNHLQRRVFLSPSKGVDF